MRSLVQIFSSAFNKGSTVKQRSVVFLHVPKTGGTTFRNILLKLYGESYCYANQPGIQEVLQLLEKFRCVEFHNARFQDEDIYTHKEIIQEQYWEILKKKHIFIMFRNPVDRVISNYFELERRRAREGREGFTFDQFLKRKGEHNKQTGFLLGNHPSSGKFPQAGDLPFVKRLLAELKVHIGFLERYDESLNIFQAVTGLAIPAKEINIENATNQDLLNQIDQKTREIIKEKNALDVELYEFALQLFEKQIKKIARRSGHLQSFEYISSGQKFNANQALQSQIIISATASASPAPLETDTPLELADLHAPGISYIICATPRCGSSLLCQALSDTTLAGRPEEYFLYWYYSTYEPHLIQTDYDRSWLLPPAAYLQRIFQSATKNGVVGIKSMYTHFAFFLERLRHLNRKTNLDSFQILNRVFPKLRFVYIQRKDAIRQAVSWAKAEQTGIWETDDQQNPRRIFMDAGAARTPDYNFEHILRLYEKAQRLNIAWEKFFNDHGIQPCRIEYESLVTEYQDAIVHLLDDLQIERPSPTELPPPRLKKQGDYTNEDWAERFRNEFKDDSREFC